MAPVPHEADAIDLEVTGTHPPNCAGARGPLAAIRSAVAIAHQVLRLYYLRHESDAQRFLCVV
jgi:hypothetical protein